MARYKDAVEWIAENDDQELDAGDPEDHIFIVSICLIADLFNKDTVVVYNDVVKYRERMKREENK